MCKRDERIVEEWNEKYPVGTIVRYWRGEKDGFPSGRAMTESKAFFSAGVPVIYLAYQMHPLQLSHVEVVEEGR